MPAFWNFARRVEPPQAAEERLVADQPPQHVQHRRALVVDERAEDAAVALDVAEPVAEIDRPLIRLVHRPAPHLPQHARRRRRRRAGAARRAPRSTARTLRSATARGSSPSPPPVRTTDARARARGRNRERRSNDAGSLRHVERRPSAAAERAPRSRPGCGRRADHFRRRASVKRRIRKVAEQRRVELRDLRRARERARGRGRACRGFASIDNVSVLPPDASSTVSRLATWTNWLTRNAR